MSIETKNPLGEQPVNRLLSQFAIPSIISMLVGSLYNIVDQFFIGQRVGELGNAATNIAFPLSTSCLALALLIGIGGSSAFNLAMGSGDDKKAVHLLGNAVVLLAGSGLFLSIITFLFLKPLLLFFWITKSGTSLCHRIYKSYGIWISIFTSWYRWRSFDTSRWKTAYDDGLQSDRSGD